MIADIAIGGVLLPGLLVIALVALIGAAIILRLLTLTGADRAFARRPLVELATFVILFGLLAQYLPSSGLMP
jgi:hypothetical protein